MWTAAGVWIAQSAVVTPGRVPHVRQSVHGPKMDSSNAFALSARIVDLGRFLCAYIPKALGGLRPSFSAHVRFGEHGAPVRFPPPVPMTQADSLRALHSIPDFRRPGTIELSN